jgi:glycine C-acetyltransferase
MHDDYLTHLRRTVDAIRADGFYKAERVIESPQSSQIVLSSGAEVLNFCANNYLGLANDRRLVAAAREGLEHWGFGMASVRFICGTGGAQGSRAGDFRIIQTDDSILYSSCFDANGGRVRNAARRRRRRHQRRIESCQHRRRNPLVRRGACAIATTTWPTSRPG